MLLYHVAKVLEVCGFLLGTIFGGILLSPEIVGRFAHRTEAKLFNMSSTLHRQFESLYKPFDFLMKFEGMLGAIVIRGIAVGCITAGWLNDVLWLFWVGIALAIPYILLGAVLAFLWLISRAGLKWMGMYPIVLCWALTSAFLVAPIALVLYWSLLMSHGVVTLVISTLALRDATKKALVILGSALILSGLVLESIATW